MKWRWVIAAVLIALLLDFNAFRDGVSRLEAQGPLEGDAIVVLTGGSGLRIASGMDRLANGEAERLLISGVNRAVTRKEVATRAGGHPELYDCCVDIGYEANSTLGNADEVHEWAREHGFERLILVTSDYHMPRAVLVMEDGGEGLDFLPAPVRTRIDPTRTFSDWRSFRGMCVEWAKWRVTSFLSLFI